MTEQPEVFLLGSGESISGLTDQERAHINGSLCRLALNKFTIFHKVAGIVPTHVFFIDYGKPESRGVIQRLFNVCIADKLRDLTFVLNHQMMGKPQFSRGKQLRQVLRGVVKRRRIEPVYLAPEGCSFEYIRHTDWLQGGPWATSIEEPLFHFRASLTTALNYASIRFPGATIKLVGVDLNSSRYFFQDHIERLRLKWKDWTTSIAADRGVHFTALEHEGTTVFDKFDFILESLGRTGNRLANCNPDSLFVQKDILPYVPVCG